MQSKTQTTLSQLRIGDSFVYPKRVDAWRVMARADKNGRVAVNQVSSSRKTIHQYDELKRGSTTAKYWRRAGFVALLLIVAQMMDEPLMLIVSRQPAFCQYIVSCRFSSAYNLTK